MKAKIDGAEEGLTNSEPIYAVICCSSINKLNFLMAFHNLTLLLFPGKEACCSSGAGRHGRKPATDIN